MHAILQCQHALKRICRFVVNSDEFSQRELADAIRVPYQRINEFANGRRGITPNTALRLAKFFGVSADFWMNLQTRWDLYQAQRDEKHELKKIQPCVGAGWPVSAEKTRGDARNDILSPCLKILNAS